MLDKTNIALWASMVKWRNQCAPHLVAGYITIGAATCALCIKFNHKEDDSEEYCVGCPLYDSENGCREFGSPYHNVIQAIKSYDPVEEFNAIERMFDVLADLCPPMPDN